MECDGGFICVEENGNHEGSIRPVLISGFGIPSGSHDFYYCDYAISRDERLGFNVEVLDGTPQ